MTINHFGFYCKYKYDIMLKLINPSPFDYGGLDGDTIK